MEKIGGVTLDYQFYKGDDMYSDGEIEDTLLRLAQNSTPNNLDQIIRENADWPTAYHFSKKRQNIIEWVPLDEGASVLEIGAGCGAITGAIAKKVKRVTCVDLSKKRSLINAYRNRDCENVKILVGNFQDIEPNLSEKYDCITLIGVLEYGKMYIQAENPYLEFLKIISRHLKEGGCVITAIENKMGLKYFAGCQEDHIGKFYA